MVQVLVVQNSVVLIRVLPPSVTEGGSRAFRAVVLSLSVVHFPRSFNHGPFATVRIPSNLVRERRSGQEVFGQQVRHNRSATLIEMHVIIKGRNIFGN